MGQLASVTLNFSAVVEGDYVTLTLNGVIRTLTAGSEQGPDTFLAGSAEVARQSFMSAVQSGGTGDLYSLGGTGTQVIITATRQGNKYNFGTVFTGGGIAWTGQQDNVNDPLSATATVSNVLCYGTPTGIITLEVVGGAYAKTFAWNGNLTSQDLIGVPAGTYSVLITEEDGQTFSINDLAVTEPAGPLVVLTEKQDVSQFAGTNGSITLQVSGGTPGYTFAWADGPTTKDRFNLPAGAYSVTVSDANGCSSVHAFSVTQPTGLEVIAEVDFDSIRLTVIGGVGPYVFVWLDGASTQNRTGLEPGTYSCTITDSKGATATITVTLSANRFYFSKNPIPLQLQATGLAQKPNLTFICEVWIEREYLSGIYELVGVPLEQPADRDGGTVFNVQEVLDAYLRPFFPSFGQNYVSLATGAFRRFYLRHTERFGEIPENSLFTQINQNYVVLGGLSDEEYTAGSFGPYLNAKMPFFTWDPAQKAVFPDQPEYLFFLPLTNGAFQVRAQVTFTDGNVVTVPVATQEGARRHELWCLPAGYAQLSLGTVDPEKKVRSWKLFVVDANGDPVSESRTFTLETDFFQHRRYFLYLNSIGGVNTLACTGAARKNLETEAQQIEKPLGLNYDPDLGDVQVSKKYGKPMLSVNSGYKTRQYMEALQDFEISPMVRLVGKDRYVPGAVATRRASVLDEMKTLNSLSFDFVLPKMYRYTPAL